MNQITITQVNWNGKGEDRVFTHYRSDRELDAFLQRTYLAFNMDHTVVTVERQEHRRSDVPEWVKRNQEGRGVAKVFA